MNGSQIFGLITGMLSGVALFMFGMNMMSDTLTQATGGRLSGAIEKLTENRLTAWALGALLAVFVQSSVTTVMTIGLVNSGIIKVLQSVGLIIGANLGTTATAWLLSLNSLGGSSLLKLLKPSSITPFLAIGGVISLMFAGSEKKRSVGTIIVGFSIMMIGMDMMSNAVEPLQRVPAFDKMMFSFSNPFIGVLVGVLCTVLIQSSAATIGILQAMAISVGVTYGMAVPIVCGAQIGTCLTAILASLGANNKGKRVALIHLLYNVIRNMLFLLALYAICTVSGASVLKAKTGAVGIAAFHTGINLLGSAIFLPLGNGLVVLVHKLLPYTEKEKKEEEDTLTILNPLFLKNPSFAIDQVKTASGMLADTVQEYFDSYLSTVSQSTQEQIARTNELGERAERYAGQLRKYCISISERRLKDEDAKNLAFLQSAVNDFAEMADMITDMFKSIMQFREEGGHFSAEAMLELEVLGSAIQEILEVSVNDYSDMNTKMAEMIQVYREIITDMQGKISKKNVKRLHSGECSREGNRTFSELCRKYEKIIDRCDSIATHILLSTDEKRQMPSEEMYGVIRDLFRDKYSVLDE